MICFLNSCREQYVPKPVTIDLNYLVIDGFINANAGEKTVIKLSRTKKINDSTIIYTPEMFASINIEEENGNTYYLQQSSNGEYISQLLNIDKNRKYRLNINTTNGAVYQSSFVEVRIPPPVDSITWKQDNDVSLFVNTNDPKNNTRYYMWNFTETWEYRSFYDSRLGFENGYISFLDDDKHKTVCYQSKESNAILVGSSAALSEDIISHELIGKVFNGQEKLAVRYSILVRQMAITQEAKQYWDLMKKNSEQVGGLFDPQPSQLFSNYSCISNPNEIAIGYLSASGVEEKRIFIDNDEVKDWFVSDPSVKCEITILGDTSQSSYFPYFSSGAFLPVYYTSGPGLAISQSECVDCTLKGGTLTKPPYW